MSPPTERPRSEPASPSRAATAVLLGAILVATGLVAYSLTIPSPTSPTYPNVGATLGVSTIPLRALGPGFLGINVRADEPLGPTLAAALNHSSVHLLRWPGGALSDRFDALGGNGAGTIYNDNGSGSAADTSFAEFAHTCTLLGCTAIVTLPVETNNSSYGAALARYALTTLGFTPTYWELGNEPARWLHFGVAWARWSGSQNLTPTPAQYASAASRYASAIRSVDPTAQFLAPGGVGFGGATETAWVEAVVSALGSRLAGVSMHVYPAGTGSGAPTPAQFYGTLDGSGGIVERVEAVQAAIATACTSCSLPIFLDEFAAQTSAPGIPLQTGYSLVPFVAAEIVQAASLPIAATGFWLLESSYPAAWFDPNGGARPTYALYSNLLQGLPPSVLPTTVNSTAHGVYAQVFRENSSGRVTVLVVNANTSVGISLNLSAWAPSSGGANRTFWDGTTSAPVRSLWSAGQGSQGIPPLSVVRFDGLELPARLAPATAHSENSGMAPGSIVPNDSTVKNCFIAPVAGQMPIHGKDRPRPSLTR